MRVPHLIAAALGLALLSGCTSIPADPDHSLEKIKTSHVLRVGASPADDFVEIEGDKVSGKEAELVTKFAERLGAKVQWDVEGEEHLLRSLEDEELDLIIGGLTSETPWTKKAALTRPYLTDKDEKGRERKHVIAAPLGENALVVALERFLDEEAPRG